MPPVRWKLTAVAVLYLIHIAAATRTPKDLIDDGWKPIIGHTSGPGVINYHQTKKNDEANLSYRDPVDIKKLHVATSPKPISTKSIKQHGHSHLNKVPPINKQSTYPTGHGYNGNQPPINFMTHRSQTKLYKVPVMGKNHVPIGNNGKRIVKPVRSQSGAYNQKDEILALAPSTGLGNYAFFNPALGSIKPRPPQQTNSDYYNQFAAQNNDLYRFQRLPIQQYVLPKNQLQNEVHYTFQAQNDEYTRNLVPPPRSQQYNVEKERVKEKPVTFKEIEQAKPSTERIKAIKQGPENQILTDTVLYQIPPPFQQPTYYVPPQQQVGFDVQVTKENIREFHNNNNNNNPYQQENIYNSDFGSYKFSKKPTETPSIPTYEVTEEKEWQESPPTYQHQFQPMKNVNKNKHPLVKQQSESFLPTPLNPSGAIPTSPTQSEISTIFTELSQKINRQKENLDPNFFIVKEVSTHYPILSNPNAGQFNWQYTIPAQDSMEYPNEITTTSTPKSRYRIKETETPSEIQTTTPITTTTVKELPQRRRPGHRRRRPVNRNKFTTEEPITTTNYYDLQKEIQETTVKHRRRRPTQVQRTTEAPSFIETATQRIRHRVRTRPTVASVDQEVPQNHKMISEEVSKPIRGSYVYKSGRRRPTKYYSSSANEGISDEEDYPSSENYKAKDTKEKEINKYYPQESSSEINYEVETNEESSEEMFEDYKKETSTNQPSEDITTIIPTPRNFEYITKPSTEEIQRGRITIKEIYTTEPEIPDDETTLATTTVPTTTTSTTTTTEKPTTTTKINRFRRPIHYKPPRPKFSVKDYHQRLNQYISSTEASKVNTESVRTRLQYRTRRPTLKQEEHVEEKTESTRKKFIPKSQRQPTLSENNEETTEVMKTVNARLRPFGRYRSTTTESPSTQKVSIKPSIFSTLRRPPPLTLKERIQNKNRLNPNEKIEPSTTEEDKQNDIDTTEHTAILTTTETPTTTKLLTTPTSGTTTTESNLDEVEEHESQDISSVDIIKNDPLLQSQRVSDLTSSTQNQYNTPGMFKNVSPNVRRIPNYFTLATDDPILPIEAFFPNINKDRPS